MIPHFPCLSHSGKHMCPVAKLKLNKVTTKKHKQKQMNSFLSIQVSGFVLSLTMWSYKHNIKYFHCVLISFNIYLEKNFNYVKKSLLCINSCSKAICNRCFVKAMIEVVQIKNRPTDYIKAWCPLPPAQHICFSVQGSGFTQNSMTGLLEAW